MFVVIENTPGYMPDADEPAEFEDYADAVAYANELADELEEQGFVCDRSWASSGNYYAIHCEETEGIARLGRFIAVELAEDDPSEDLPVIAGGSGEPFDATYKAPLSDVLDGDANLRAAYLADEQRAFYALGETTC